MKQYLLNISQLVISKFFPEKGISLRFYRDLLKNKSGLEIGGPSSLFSKKGLIPIYPVIKTLDNCNFSSSTLWEGNIEEGLTFNFDKKHSKGRQFILDATELSEIASDQYEFLLSSHVIEHIANPIKALHEWIRVLKNGGILLLILPHKDGTFDHKRNLTDLNHLIDDYKNQIQESDLTHLDEILELHDLSRDLLAGSSDNFRLRSKNNFKNRCLHHHVFNSYSAAKLIDYVKLKLISVEAVLPFHIIIVAQKSSNSNNQKILDSILDGSFKTSFDSDKVILKT